MFEVQLAISSHQLNLPYQKDFSFTLPSEALDNAIYNTYNNLCLFQPHNGVPELLNFISWVAEWVA